jgi:hypothetical protein
MSCSSSSSRSSSSNIAIFTKAPTSQGAVSSQHVLTSSLTDEHEDKDTSQLPEPLTSIFRTCYNDFIQGKEMNPDNYDLLQSLYVSQTQFIKLVVDPELPGSQGIYLQDNHILFKKPQKDPHGQIIGDVIYQISNQDVTMGKYLMGGTGNRIIIFRISTDTRSSTWSE